MPTIFIFAENPQSALKLGSKLGCEWVFLQHPSNLDVNHGIVIRTGLWPLHPNRVELEQKLRESPNIIELADSGKTL